MNCPQCKKQVPEGSQTCPYCGRSLRYGGNTEFYRKAAGSGLKLKDVFTDVLKHHDKSDGERLFMAGTQVTTPSESNMLREWQKPWVFARVGFIGILISFALYLMAYYLKTYAAFMMIGSFVIPVTALMFYWEMNITRNIPLYEVALMFLTGGVISLFVSMLFFQVVDTEISSFAAFCEEPGKLLALAFFLRKPEKKYILNGILIGGAVGAGFSAMETAGYALEVLTRSGDAASVVITRGILSPGGHVVWAAMYGGALAMVKGSGRLEIRQLGDMRFLKYFLAAVGLHFIWNSGIAILPLPYVGDLSYVILTAAGWILLFTVIQKGISQIVGVTGGTAVPAGHAGQAQTGRKEAVSFQDTAVLMGVSGPYKGQSIMLQNGKIILGRDPGACSLVFPPQQAGISRIHCSLTFDGNAVWLTDEGSAYGTYLADGRRLTAGNRVRLCKGDRFCLGTADVMFEVRGGR